MSLLAMILIDKPPKSQLIILLLRVLSSCFTPIQL